MSTIYEFKDDGGLRLNFHPGQYRAWNSSARYIWVLAGTQGGKTSFGPWWLNREIDRIGRGDYLAGTASYDLFKLKMLPELREVVEHILRRGRYWSKDKIIELRDPTTGRFWAQRADDSMWGRIILRSAESKGGLESATALAAWLDECGQDSFNKLIIEAVIRRLSLQRGRILGTTTLYNFGWLKSIYDAWSKGQLSDTEIIQFASIYNPEFSRSEYEEAKARMPEWRFRMFYKGEFEKPAGVVYDCFDRETHVVEAFRKPDDWVVYSGLDFGGVHTAALQLLHDPAADVYYISDEYLTGKKTAKQHSAKLKRWRSRRWVGGSWSEDQWRIEFRAAGLLVNKPPIKDLDVGLDRVYELFKTGRLFVFDSCEGTISQLEDYRRPVDDDGEAIPGKPPINKEKYHYLDALRYIGSWLNRRKPKPAGKREQLPKRVYITERPRALGRSKVR